MGGVLFPIVSQAHLQKSAEGRMELGQMGSLRRGDYLAFADELSRMLNQSRVVLLPNGSRYEKD
jgi:hypothetical protein